DARSPEAQNRPVPASQAKPPAAHCSRTRRRHAKNVRQTLRTPRTFPARRARRHPERQFPRMHRFAPQLPRQFFRILPRRGSADGPYVFLPDFSISVSQNPPHAKAGNSALACILCHTFSFLCEFTRKSGRRTKNSARGTAKKRTSFSFFYGIIRIIQ